MNVRAAIVAEESLGTKVTRLERALQAALLRISTLETQLGRVRLVVEANRIEVLKSIECADPAKPTKPSVKGSKRIQEAEAKALIEALIVMACTDAKISRNCLLKSLAHFVSAVRDWVWFEGSAKGVSSTQMGRIFNRDHSSVIVGIHRESARRAKAAQVAK